MILLVGLALIGASVAARGGRLGRLSELRLRRTPHLVIAVALQVMAIEVPSEHLATSTAGIIHAASFALALWFVLGNRGVPGIGAIAVGGALNGLAVAFNGGVMPASRWAVEVSGVALPDEGFTNSGVVDGARLAYLGDVFPLPGPSLIANVFSVGDVILVIGCGWLMHRVCVGEGPLDRSDGDAETLELVGRDGVAP